MEYGTEEPIDTGVNEETVSSVAKKIDGKRNLC